MFNDLPLRLSALTNAVRTIKGTGGGLLNAYYLYNSDTNVIFIQFFDAAKTTDVTLGTTVPKWSIGIPGGQAANVSRLKLQFSDGIQVACTATETGAGAPGAPANANFGYR
jgi:hypothetical protein